MFVRITSMDPPVLCEADDFRRLHVEIVGFIGDGDADSALGAFGHIRDGHAWLNAAHLKSEVAKSASQGWSDRFDKMMFYAASCGWMNETMTAVRAHIVRSPETGDAETKAHA